MTSDTSPVLYAVYSRKDEELVRKVVTLLKSVGVEVWIDVERISPGSNWQNQIIMAINSASGALVFVSPSLVQSHMALTELETFHDREMPIIPLIIKRVLELPPALQIIIGQYQQIDLTGNESGIPDESLLEYIKSFVAGIPHAREHKRVNETPQEVIKVAETIANAMRKTPPAVQASASPPKSVFIVHGHDDGLLKDVEQYLGTLGVESIVLRRIGGPAQSLFRKFMQWGTETRFALILLTADDLGVSRMEYYAEGAGAHALQFRARQNVILELGFFYGHLGWENVFVLFKKADKNFPRFERPSDLDGVVFDIFEESGDWKGYLKAKLEEAGFQTK